MQLLMLDTESSPLIEHYENHHIYAEFNMTNDAFFLAITVEWIATMVIAGAFLFLFMHTNEKHACARVT